MTELLKKAFDSVSALPEATQDEIARRLLDDLEDDDFDRKIAATAHLLGGMAREALAERRAGKTRPLDQGDV